MKKSAVRWTGKGGNAVSEKDTELAEKTVLRCAASGNLAHQAVAVVYAGKQMKRNII